MASEKFCPKCPNNIAMEPLDLIVGPLTVRTPGGPGRGINVGIPDVGLPIDAYECPQCGIIEFYHKRDT